MDSKVLEEIEQKAKMKINKQHLRKLVTDHLTMACKSALPDERMFTVEALVGITLSSKEVMLINVKENVSNQLTKNVAKDKRNMSSSVDDVSEALKRKFEHEPTKTSSKRKSDKIKTERSGSPVVKRSRVSLPPQHRVRNSYDPPELDALRKLTAPNEALTGWYSQVLPQSLVIPPFLNGSFQNAARPPPLQHPMFSSRQYPGLSEDDSSPRNQSPQPEDDKSAEALDMTKTDDYEETDVNMNKTTPLKLLAQTVIEQTTRSNGGEEIKRSSSCEPIVNKQNENDSESEGLSGDLTNICPQCGVTLSTNTALKRHMLIHDGVKPYNCTICEKKFRQKTDLQRHLCTHTKKYPFSCPLCDFKCVARHSLKAHGRNKHNMPDLHYQVVPASLDELVPMSDYNFEAGQIKKEDDEEEAGAPSDQVDSNPEADSTHHA